MRIIILKIDLLQKNYKTKIVNPEMFGHTSTTIGSKIHTITHIKATYGFRFSEIANQKLNQDRKLVLKYTTKLKTLRF